MTNKATVSESLQSIIRGAAIALTGWASTSAVIRFTISGRTWIAPAQLGAVEPKPWSHAAAIAPASHGKTAMIALILSTCLLSDPQVCREQVIPLDAPISARSCVMTAPPHVAQWCVEHPEWRVVRWSCRLTTDRDT